MHHVSVSISEIRIGDTVIHEGKMKTVSLRNFGRDDLMGLTLFGDSFKLGRELVQKVIFPKFFQGSRIN